MKIFKFVKKVFFIELTILSDFKNANSLSCISMKNQECKTRPQVVNVDEIVVSDKFKHNNEGFKYFIGYQEGEIVKPLCIILSQMSGYIKYFENDEEVWEKYEQIWDFIKNKLGIKFHREPVYDKTYIKTEVREFSGKIKTNFLGNEVPKGNMHYTCITIDSAIWEMIKKIICKFI